MRICNLTFVSIGLAMICSCNRKEKVQLININNNFPKSEVVGSKAKAKAFVTCKASGDLTIFVPTYKTVNFVCGKRPQLSDASVVYCAEAAFTGECLDSFQHFNIAGNHVSEGVYYKGYKAKANTGAFVWYQDKWKFVYDNYAKELRAAASHGGMGFGQNMVIYQGCAQPRFRKDKPQNIYHSECFRGPAKGEAL